MWTSPFACKLLAILYRWCNQAVDSTWQSANLWSWNRSRCVCRNTKGFQKDLWGTWTQNNVDIWEYNMCRVPGADSLSAYKRTIALIQALLLLTVESGHVKRYYRGDWSRLPSLIAPKFSTNIRNRPEKVQGVRYRSGVTRASKNLKKRFPTM